MKRVAVIGISAAVLLVAGFGGGYWYRHSYPPMQGEMEDYALSNILSEVAYVHYLKKGDLEGVRNLIDIELNTHLARVVKYQGAITDDEFMASKIRALNAVANVWDERPPFDSLTGSENQPWWQGWQDMTRQNRDLLGWARERCATDPSLKCRSPNPTVERDARKSGARPSP